MKAFRKWLVNTLDKANKVHELHKPVLYVKEEIVWRAAMEEVLTQLDRIYDGDFDSDIVEWIKTELEK